MLKCTDEDEDFFKFYVKIELSIMHSPITSFLCGTQLLLSDDTISTCNISKFYLFCLVLCLIDIGKF